MASKDRGKPKGKAGRPPAVNPRVEFIGLKVTRQERERLGREAAGAGLSLSEFIMRPHRTGWAMEKKPLAGNVR